MPGRAHSRPSRGVDRRRIDLGGAGFTVVGADLLRWRALAVASKPAPYSPNRDAPVPGDNVALVIEDQDAAILANCPDRAVRRSWVQRILDHDGYGEDPGGIDSRLRLAEAVGLSLAQVESLDLVLPGVRFAVDAYVNFARRAPWQEAVCSSLTELFAPEIHKQRLANWPEHYPWIESAGLKYFRSRISQARRDVEFGLAFTLDHFDTHALQQRAVEILKFKLDVLWAMNDAMALRYVVRS